jgi:hypothetical protein
MVNRSRRRSGAIELTVPQMLVGGGHAVIADDQQTALRHDVSA